MNSYNSFLLYKYVENEEIINLSFFFSDVLAENEGITGLDTVIEWRHQNRGYVPSRELIFSLPFQSIKTFRFVMIEGRGGLQDNGESDYRCSSKCEIALDEEEHVLSLFIPLVFFFSVVIAENEETRRHNTVMECPY